MLRRALLLAAAGLFAAAPLVLLAAEKPAEEAQPVHATQLAPGLTWEGQQYPGVDKKGRVFILRTDTLQVYPVGDQELGEPRALEGAQLDNPDPVLDASMDEHGDWVILEGFQPRWFRSGEEESLPLPPWLPSSVSLLKGHPIVTVFPFPMGKRGRRETAPRVLEYDGERWSVRVDSPLKRPTTPDERMQMHQREATRAFVDTDDTLWVAHKYRYKLAHYSAAGRELLSLEADGAEVEHQKEAKLEDRRLLLEEERARYSRPETAKIQVNSALPVIRALAEGRDGCLYLLVRPQAGGLALDRLDTVQGILSRVGITAESPGAVSMVAGADGLYLVPYNGKDKRWFLPWEALNAADWRPLGGVDGLAPAIPAEQARR